MDGYEKEPFRNKQLLLSMFSKASTGSEDAHIRALGPAYRNSEKRQPITGEQDFFLLL